jgi:hypothetical protein
MGRLKYHAIQIFAPDQGPMRALGPTGTQMRGMRWLVAANPQSPRFGGVNKNGSSKFAFEATEPAKQTLKGTTPKWSENVRKMCLEPTHCEGHF